MLKTSKNSYKKSILEAYKRFSWNKIFFNKLGNFDGHKIKENQSLYSQFQKEFPEVCPTFDYFKFMARCKIFYKDSEEKFFNSYVCPICGLRPKKDITNSGRNGKYKGKTCKNLECQTELRKRTNLERGGSTCSLQRSDVRNKVEATFMKRYGVKYAGQSEEIRNRWKKTNLEKTGHEFQFQNPVIQKQIKETFIDKYGVENPLCRESPIRSEVNKRLNEDSVIRQRRETMKLRGKVGNKSEEENSIFEELLQYFPNVDRQYGDIRYNFKCDFYIPINDLFIEYQGYFCHGLKPYNKKDRYCNDLVKKWKFRSSKAYKDGKHKNFYQNAIKSYTDIDVRKRKVAKENNLNWLEFFNSEEVSNWLETLYPNSYYEEMPINFSKESLLREYQIIQNAEPKYSSLPKNNKIVLQYQSRLFFKQELNLWKDEDIQEKLVRNRLKYIEKGWGELTAWEILRGMKISGIIKTPYSHFSQQWMRKFIKEFKVTSIYDPCGGWGHRLTACPLDFKYIYNDIRKPVVKRCKKIAKFLGMSKKIFYNEDASLLVPKERYNAVFTCPPYWNKEIYSKKGAENKSYKDFLLWWRNVVRSSCKNNPKLFAFVISEDLMKEMKKACEREGLELLKQYKLGRAKSHFLKNGHFSAEYLLVFNNTY